MRKVHLIRPRNIMASLVTVNVFLDDADKPYGKLDNFSTGILEVDEGEHVVKVQPRPKNLADNITTVYIPAGTDDYAFQLDIMDYQAAGTPKHNYMFRLRPMPIKNAYLKKVYDGELFLMTEVTYLILNPEFREKLKAAGKAAYVQLKMSEKHLKVNIVSGRNKETVQKINYYLKQKGGFTNDNSVTLQNDFFTNPRKWDDILAHMFEVCFAYIPVYKKLGEDGLMLKD